MGMHFDTSGPYKLNTVKQQKKILSRWSRKLYTVIATQACCSHHVLKFVWSETPAPKWHCLLRDQYNNNSLGMNNSQAEKPRRRKQAHCWKYPVWAATAAAGAGCFPALWALHPTSNHPTCSNLFWKQHLCQQQGFLPALPNANFPISSERDDNQTRAGRCLEVILRMTTP